MEYLMVGDWRPAIVDNATEFYALHPRLRDILDGRLDSFEINSALSEDNEIQSYTAFCNLVGFDVRHDLEKQLWWCKILLRTAAWKLQ